MVPVLSYDPTMSSDARQMVEAGWIPVTTKGSYFNLPPTSFLHACGTKDSLVFHPDGSLDSFKIKRVNPDGSKVMLETRVYMHSCDTNNNVFFYLGMDINNDCEVLQSILQDNRIARLDIHKGLLTVRDRIGRIVEMDKVGPTFVMKSVTYPSFEAKFIQLTNVGIKPDVCAAKAFQIVDAMFDPHVSPFKFVDFDMIFQEGLVLRVLHDRTQVEFLPVNGAYPATFIIDEEKKRFVPMWFNDESNPNDSLDVLKSLHSSDEFGFGQGLDPREIMGAFKKLRVVYNNWKRRQLRNQRELEQAAAARAIAMEQDAKKRAEEEKRVRLEAAAAKAVEDEKAAKIMREKEELADKIAMELLEEEEVAKAASVKSSKKSRKKASKKQRMAESMPAINEEEVVDSNDTTEDTTGDSPPPFVPLHDLRVALPESTGSPHHEEDGVSSIGGQTSCVVCFSSAKTTMAWPCLHQIVCSQCSARLYECPICRKPVEKWVTPLLV